MFLFWKKKKKWQNNRFPEYVLKAKTISNLFNEMSILYHNTHVYVTYFTKTDRNKTRDDATVGRR